MNAHEEDAERDPLFDYVNGDPDAVRAAAPREPSYAEWENVRLRIHAKLDATSGNEYPHSYRRSALWLAASVVLTAAAAAIAWIALTLPTAKNPQVPEVVKGKSQPPVEVVVAPHPREAISDPLADYPVLPMATNDEVVLHRVPGDGILPVGSDPLPSVLLFATHNDVELDDPNPAWPRVTVSSGFAPMIFAAKPR